MVQGLGSVERLDSECFIPGSCMDPAKDLRTEDVRRGEPCLGDETFSLLRGGFVVYETFFLPGCDVFNAAAVSLSDNILSPAAN